MRTLAAAVLLALAAACARAPSDGRVAYSAPDGGFSARLPAAWRVDESRGEERRAAFFGPGTGADAESIFVSFFPAGSRWRSAREYAYAQAATGRAGPVVDGARGPEVVVERELADAHLGRVVKRVRVATVAAAGGFFALEDWTDAAREAPAADFEAFAASFRAGPAAK